MCIRQMEISGGSLYAASKAIVTALKPEQPGKVRSDRYCMYVHKYVCMYVYTYVCVCAGSYYPLSSLQGREWTMWLLSDSN